MHDKRNKMARVGSAVLATTLLVFAIAKAQGCQRPMELDEPTAKSPEPQTPPQVDPSAGVTVQAAVAKQPAADAGTPDAAAPVQPRAPVINEREVFPATKAGPVFRPTSNQAPK